MAKLALIPRLTEVADRLTQAPTANRQRRRTSPRKPSPPPVMSANPAPPLTTFALVALPLRLPTWFLKSEQTLVVTTPRNRSSIPWPPMATMPMPPAQLSPVRYSILIPLSSHLTSYTHQLFLLQHPHTATTPASRSLAVFDFSAFFGVFSVFSFDFLFDCFILFHLSFFQMSTFQYGMLTTFIFFWLLLILGKLF